MLCEQRMIPLDLHSVTYWLLSPYHSLWTKAKAQIKHILYVYQAATQQKSHCSNCKILLHAHNTNQQKQG